MIFSFYHVLHSTSWAPVYIGSAGSGAGFFRRGHNETSKAVPRWDHGMCNDQYPTRRPSKHPSALPVHAKMPKKRERRDPKPLLLENQTHKRRDRAQELRSARRQGILAKRRKCDAHSAGGVVNSAGGLQQDPWSGERLAAAIQGVKDSPVAQILPHLTELRKLLSLEYSPVEEVVERAGLAPRLIDLLGAPNDEIQIEATWYDESYVIRSRTFDRSWRCLWIGFCSAVVGGAIMFSLRGLSTGNPGWICR